MKKTMIIIGIALIAMLLVAGCAGKKATQEQNPEPTPTPTPTPEPTPTPAPNPELTPSDFDITQPADEDPSLEETPTVQ